MGGITAIATGAVAFTIIASYLYLRIAPQASRMLVAPRMLRVEQNNEEAETDSKGKLNELRLKLNALKEKLWKLENGLNELLISNETLKAQNDRAAGAAKHSKDLVKNLDSVLKHVAPHATTEFTSDGVPKIKIPEQSESITPQDTAAPHHLGMPPTTAGELLGSDSTNTGDTSTPRQQPGQGKGKDNGRSL